MLDPSEEWLFEATKRDLAQSIRNGTSEERKIRFLEPNRLTDKLTYDGPEPRERQTYYVLDFHLLIGVPDDSILYALADRLDEDIMLSSQTGSKIGFTPYAYFSEYHVQGTSGYQAIARACTYGLFNSPQFYRYMLHQSPFRGFNSLPSSATLAPDRYEDLTPALVERIERLPAEHRDFIYGRSDHIKEYLAMWNVPITEISASMSPYSL